MITQPISLGLSTLNGPISISGKKGNIKRATTIKRIKSNISWRVILPTNDLNVTFADNNTIVSTVITSVISIYPKKLRVPKKKAISAVNSVVPPISPLEEVIQ